MILFQNITMSIVICTTVSHSYITMMAFIWVSYILGFLLKMVFYFGFHPWSALMRNDMKKTLKSWKNQDEPIPAWTVCFGENWMRCKFYEGENDAIIPIV